jgi:hypothetical protein
VGGAVGGYRKSPVRVQGGGVKKARRGVRCAMLYCTVLSYYGYAEKRRCPGGSESDDVTAVTMFKMTR